jgi:hypothetical protein
VLVPIPVNAFLNHVFGGFSITPYEIIKVQKRVSEAFESQFYQEAGVVGGKTLVLVRVTLLDSAIPTLQGIAL